MFLGNGLKIYVRYWLTNFNTVMVMEEMFL